VPAAPHVTAHSELPVQVVLQSPSHLTLHVVEPEHAIVLPAPTSILHVALVSQTTIDASPSLRSQFELAVQVTLLSLPPAALHCDESLHVIVIASLLSPSHFVAIVQASEQGPSQVALQSVPAAQAQLLSAHVQPVPLQTGAPLSLPQATSVVKHAATRNLVISSLRE